MTAKGRARVQRHFRDIDLRLKALIDRDPRAAIEAAHALAPDGILSQLNVNLLAAGILIDGGVAAHDVHAVNEGVELLKRIHVTLQKKGDIQYCLANGLCAQADSDGTTYPQWYTTTADVRRRARRLYQSAASDHSLPMTIRAMAHTNIGNSLLRAYRFVEAYDCYVRALKCDHTNGVALTGAAGVLIRLAQAGIGTPQVLYSVAAKYLAKAKEDPDRIRELAGEQAYRSLSKLLKADLPVGEMPDLSTASQYQKFVAQHRLSLAPTIEGLDLSLSRWDSLRVQSLTVPSKTGSSVPPLFGMFNVLKSEFLVARYLAFSALKEALPESGKYSDTLDYARYGIQPSMLTLAQRACLDLLDKVASAASEYFTLPGDPTRIYFTNRWFEHRRSGEPLRWQPKIQEAIMGGNKAIIAISEVSGDIADGGFLREKHAMRNSSTHRFAILHDLGGKPEQASAYIDHFSFDEFADQTIETLQLTRAVLLYFVEMVAYNEGVSEGNNVIKGQLFVPDHDWIRGEDSSG